MRHLLFSAAFAMVAFGAAAQNTKGTGAESQTSTTTNPQGTVMLPTPSDGRQHAAPATSADHRRMETTKSAQDAYEKQGKSGASLR